MLDTLTTVKTGRLISVVHGLFVVLASGCMIDAWAGQAQEIDYDAKKGRLTVNLEQQSLQRVLEALAQQLDFELRGALPDRPVSLQMSGSVEDVLRQLVAPGSVVISHRADDATSSATAPLRPVSKVWILGTGMGSDFLPNGKPTVAVVPPTGGGRLFRGKRSQMSPEQRALSHKGNKHFATTTQDAGEGKTGETGK